MSSLIISLFFFCSRAQDPHHRRPRHVRGRGQHGQPELRRRPYREAAREGQVDPQRERDLIPGTQRRSVGELSSKKYAVERTSILQRQSLKLRRFMNFKTPKVCEMFGHRH